MNSKFKYQEVAVKKLSKLKAGCLFMQMGAGKTKVAVDLANLKNDYDYIVWIAPASLLKTVSYIEEIDKWQPLKPVRFWSIESLGSSDYKYCDLVNFITKFKTFCIVDESITIKNTEAKRTERLLKLWDKFNYRFILNGTPITNGLIDLYSQIQFIHPKILGMTETQFANNFLTYKNGGYKPWKRWSKPENEEALIEIIRPYIFDCELDIPVDCEVYHLDNYLNADEWLGYNELKDDYFKDKHYDDIDYFSMTQKFQHFYTKCHEKYLKIKSIIAAKPAEKFIVYVKYLDEIEELKKILKNYTILTGSAGKKTAIEEFKKDKQVLICTYGVGSFGLNLQFANNIIYFTQTFDYKLKEQSKHRIYRTGQTRTCYFYDFFVNTGLESIIERSLNKKENTLDNVKNYIKDKGEKEWKKSL